jgi:hypothetical protein
VKARLVTAPMVVALAAAGCATPKVNDDTRYGRPVFDTTIAAIRINPEAWENKWVRLTGYVNGAGSAMYGNECLVKALSTQTEDSCLDDQPPNPDGQGHVFDVDRKLVDLDGYDILDLDPEAQQPTEYRDHSSISKAVVVGRVDLACWHWYQPTSQWIDNFIATHPDQIPLVHFRPPEKIAYCYGLGGEPHLDRVLIAKGASQ